MVIPFIAATMRDVFETVPPVYKESAYGVGCTTWEVMRSIVLPYTRVSVVGGIMLGLGRALGETMAVTFVIGNTNRIATSLFGPGNTIASHRRAGVSRKPGRQPEAFLAAGARLHPVRDLVHRAGDLAAAAAAAAEGLTMSATTTMRALPGPAKDQAVSRAARAAAPPDRTGGQGALRGCDGASASLLLASILFTLLWRGVGGLSLSVFTQIHPAAGLQWRAAQRDRRQPDPDRLGTLIGTPIGLMVGTYLAEYGRSSALGNAVRFVSDVLLSAPSILIGLFIYQLVRRAVRRLLRHRRLPGAGGDRHPDRGAHHRGHAAADPATLREAAVALGAPKWKMIVLVCYRAAKDGIVTGILLAVARIAGETAPLLFTSLGNLNWSLSLRQPMASLPVTIYQYAGSAFEDWVAACLGRRAADHLRRAGYSTSSARVALRGRRAS